MGFAILAAIAVVVFLFFTGALEGTVNAIISVIGGLFEDAIIGGLALVGVVVLVLSFM